MVEASSFCSNGNAVKCVNTTTVKFLCSYGGKILPRPTDGQLRYVGGDTRVLAVDRSISFSDLLVKMGELCGSSVSLRCQLPKEDLDALVSITCDEDLENIIEEYDLASKVLSKRGDALKIRAFLYPKSTAAATKSLSPPPSVTSSASPPGSRVSSVNHLHQAGFVLDRCFYHQVSYPICFKRSAGPQHHYYALPQQRNPNHIYYLNKGGSLWQENHI